MRIGKMAKFGLVSKISFTPKGSGRLAVLRASLIGPPAQGKHNYVTTKNLVAEIAHLQTVIVALGSELGMVTASSNAAEWKISVPLDRAAFVTATFVDNGDEGRQLEMASSSFPVMLSLTEKGGFWRPELILPYLPVAALTLMEPRRAYGDTMPNHPVLGQALTVEAWVDGATF
jgi:hypothetical protein